MQIWVFVSPSNRSNSGNCLQKICFQSPHLTACISTRTISLKGDTAPLVTGQIFSASQTALPISWLAGIQQQLERSQVKGCQLCGTRGGEKQKTLTLPGALLQILIITCWSSIERLSATDRTGAWWEQTHYTQTVDSQAFVLHWFSLLCRTALSPVVN